MFRENISASNHAITQSKTYVKFSQTF